jgi:excisionase family DNA binding protein
MLNISLRTVDAMTARGELRAVRYGGRTMIPASEIDRLLGVRVTAPSGSLTYDEIWRRDHLDE